MWGSNNLLWRRSWNKERSRKRVDRFGNTILIKILMLKFIILQLFSCCCRLRFFLFSSSAENDMSFHVFVVNLIKSLSKFYSNIILTLHLSTSWLCAHWEADNGHSKNISHVHCNPYIAMNQLLSNLGSEIIKSYGILKNKSKLYFKNWVVG
jgi:hypothetical protein